MRILRGLAIGLLVLLTTAAIASGQASAELSGRVTDQSGAVLPGVTVTVNQTDTGFTRSVVTDGAGAWVMPNLPTGPYRMEVSLQGFRSYVQTGIVLQVASTPTINTALALGDLAETVTVDAAAPLVDVRSAGISEVVEQQRILELPLQGRQVTDLIMLAGGAVQTGAPGNRHFMGGGVNISVAGGQNFGVAYLLDGAMHNDPQNNVSLPLPFPDALQEFSVATGGLSAQNGMHSGASVNAVTKSGTNRLSGNLFEFFRDSRFNATNRFAAVGRDGKRLDDGLRRNQYGGTLGGPILRDRLFFFGAYQGTGRTQDPPENIQYVPTAAMMAGDFSAFASPACNVGRQITLRAPFVNNRIDPRLFSPAAVNLVKRLPGTTDPCGEIRYATSSDTSEGQAVGKVDYQRSANHSLFGRYMATFMKSDPPYAKYPDNLLTSADSGLNNWARSFALGDTYVLGADVVNALRFTFNTTTVDRYNLYVLDPHDLGSKVYAYEPGHIRINITGGFTLGGNSGKGMADNKTYQISDDLTLVRGKHQLGLGASLAYWRSEQYTNARTGGQWTFNGQVTGLGLADLMIGRVAVMEHGGPGGLTLEQDYLGLYAQDTWRTTNRVTINAGLRWEPFFGQQILNGAIDIFSLDNFRKGVQSGVFHNAPPGFIYPGDPGFPSGRTGMNAQWWNLSPRVGVGWDVHGNGRLAVRASYGLTYDFPTGAYQFLQASSPPYGNRLQILDPAGLFDDPYRDLGGDPNPIITSPDTKFPLYGSFGAMDPNIQSPRVQSWNVTVERQIGAAWQVAASYLGNYTDRLWGLLQRNPAVYLGLGPCTLNGVSYPTCTTNTNQDQRRVLSLENPTASRLIGAIDQFSDVGTQTYRGLKLSARRTAAAVSFNGNYTWSRCFGAVMANDLQQVASGYTNPADPSADDGHCLGDRTHIFNLTAGTQTPRFDSPVLRAVASDWRVSGIVGWRSGGWLTVTSGRDNAFNGQTGGQRVNQIIDDVYGVKTLNNYLSRDAFEQPASGTFGNHVRASIKGPSRFNGIDLSLSKTVSVSGRQNLELRLEAFNLVNHFAWGIPNTTFTSGSFGRITTLGLDPRILQFGVKYGF